MCSSRYAASDKTQQQRQVNASTRQFQGFMRTLHGKLRLHLDDVARLQEIANMVKHTLPWETVRELYVDEHSEAVEAEVAARTAGCKAGEGGGSGSGRGGVQGAKVPAGPHLVPKQQQAREPRAQSPRFWDESEEEDGEGASASSGG